MSAVSGLHLELRRAVEALQCAGELLRTPKHLSLALKKNKGFSAWVGTVQITAHCPLPLIFRTLAVPSPSESTEGQRSSTPGRIGSHLPCLPDRPGRAPTCPSSSGIYVRRGESGSLRNETSERVEICTWSNKRLDEDWCEGCSGDNDTCMRQYLKGLRSPQKYRRSIRFDRRRLVIHRLYCGPLTPGQYYLTDAIWAQGHS